jgi:hypothetical protein
MQEEDLFPHQKPGTPENGSDNILHEQNNDLRW